MPIPPFQNTSHQVMVMKKLVKKLSKRGDLTYLELEKEVYKRCEKPFGEDKCTRFVNIENYKPIYSNEIYPAIWDTLSTRFSKDLDSALIEHVTLSDSGSIELSQALSLALLDRIAFNPNDYTRIVGEYELYHPSHVRKGEVLRYSLACRVDDDAARFVMQGKFSFSEGRDFDDLIHGHIIPYANLFMLLGQFDRRTEPNNDNRNAPPKSVYIMIVDHIWPAGGVACQIEGTALISVAGARSTAKPLYAERVLKPRPPAEIPATECEAQIDIWDEVRAALMRGYVHFLPRV